MEIEGIEFGQPILPTQVIGTIPIGTVFCGSISGRTGLFLRAYSCVVSLNNPQRVWDKIWDKKCLARIHDYQPVKAKVVVTGPA